MGINGFRQGQSLQNDEVDTRRLETAQNALGLAQNDQIAFQIDSIKSLPDSRKVAGGIILSRPRDFSR